MKSFVAIVLTGIVSAGCTTSAVQPDTRADEIEQRLMSAAGDIAEAVAKLAIVEQSARGVHAQAITPAQLPVDLQLRVSLDYQGDIEPLLNQLANTLGYRLEIYGRRRAMTPVHILADDRAVGLILADADYQSSWRCDVFVIADQRVIELRYHRNRPSA